MAIIPVAKVLHAIAFAGKAESTYGTPATLVLTTDGILLALKDKKSAAPLKYGYIYDGTVGPSVGNLGQQKRIAPAGLYVQGPLPVLFRGPGAAYSTTVRSSIDRLLIAAGFDATVVTTAGSEAVTYAPTAAGAAYGSLTGNLYGRGQKMAIAGAIGSFKIDSSDSTPPDCTFDLSAIGTLPVDIALASVTYPGYAAVSPPGGSQCALTFGSLVAANAVMKKWGFDVKRDVSPRANQQSSGPGFAGYAPGDRMPTLTFTLEATALVGTPFTSATAFDAYQLRDLATVISTTLQLGTVQYNRLKINFPQAQVIDVQDSNDGSVACVDITVAPFNSTQITADDLNLVTD